VDLFEVIAVPTPIVSAGYNPDAKTRMENAGQHWIKINEQNLVLTTPTDDFVYTGSSCVKILFKPATLDHMMNLCPFSLEVQGCIANAWPCSFQISIGYQSMQEVTKSKDQHRKNRLVHATIVVWFSSTSMENEGDLTCLETKEPVNRVEPFTFEFDLYENNTVNGQF